METVSGLPAWACETYGKNYSFHEITSAKCSASIPGTVYTNKCPNGPCIEGFPYAATSEENNQCKYFVEGTTVKREHICQILNAIQAAHYFPQTPMGGETFDDGEQVSNIVIPQWGTRSNICEFADPVNNTCTRGESADEIEGGQGTYGSGGEEIEEKISPNNGICFFPPFKLDESQYDWVELPVNDPKTYATFGRPYYTKEYTPPEDEDLTIIEIPYAGDLDFNYPNQIKQYFASSVKIDFEKLHIDGYIKISTNCGSVIYKGYGDDYAPILNLTSLELPLSTNNFSEITIEIHSESPSITENNVTVNFTGIVIREIYLYQPTMLFTTSGNDPDPVSYDAITPSSLTPYFSTNVVNGSSVAFLSGTQYSTNSNLKDKLICSTSSRAYDGGISPFFFPNYPLINLEATENKTTSNNVIAIQAGLLNIKDVVVNNWHTMMLEENFDNTTIPYYIFCNSLNMRDIVLYRKFDNVYLNGLEYSEEDDDVIKSSMDFPQTAQITFIRQDGTEETLEDVSLSWLPIYGIRFNSGPLYATEIDSEHDETTNTTSTVYPTIYGPPGEQIITQTVTDTFTIDVVSQITTISPGDGLPHTDTITTTEEYTSTRENTRTVTIPPEMIIPSHTDTVTTTSDSYTTETFVTVTSNAHHTDSEIDCDMINGVPKYTFKLFIGHDVSNIFVNYGNTPNPFGFINYSPCWAITDITIPQKKQLTYYSEITDVGGNKDYTYRYFTGPSLDDWDKYSYQIPNGVMARAIVKNPRTFVITKLYLKIVDEEKVSLGFPREINIKDFTYNKYNGLINMPLADRDSYFLNDNNGTFQKTIIEKGTEDYELYVKYKINACPYGQCTENYYQEKYSWGHFYFSSHPYGHTNQIYSNNFDTLLYTYPQYLQNILTGENNSSHYYYYIGGHKIYEHKSSFTNVTGDNTLKTYLSITKEPVIWIGDNFPLYYTRSSLDYLYPTHNNSDIYKMILWLRRYIENTMFNVPDLALRYRQSPPYNGVYTWRGEGTSIFSTVVSLRARSGYVSSLDDLMPFYWFSPYVPQYIYGGTDLTRTAIYSGIGSVTGTHHTCGALISFSKTAGYRAEVKESHGGGYINIPPRYFYLYSKYNGDLTWTYKILCPHYYWQQLSPDFTWQGNDYNVHATRTVSFSDLYKIKTMTGCGITVEFVPAYVVNLPFPAQEDGIQLEYAIYKGTPYASGEWSGFTPDPTYGWETWHLPLRRYSAFLMSDNVVYEYIREKTNINIDVFDFNAQFKLRCLYAYNKNGKTYCRKSLFGYGFSNREIMNEQCPCPNILSEKNCYVLPALEVATATGPYVYTSGDKTIDVLMRTYSPGDGTRTQITAIKINAHAEKMELYIQREQSETMKLYRTYDNINTDNIEKTLRMVSYYPYKIRIKLYGIKYFEYKTNDVVTFILQTTTKTLHDPETDIGAHSWCDERCRTTPLKMEYYCIPLIGELVKDLQQFAKKITQGYRQMWNKTEYKDYWKLRNNFPDGGYSESDYSETIDKNLVSFYYTNRRRGAEREGQITYASFPYPKADDKPFPEKRDDSDRGQKDYIWPDI